MSTLRKMRGWILAALMVSGGVVFSQTIRSEPIRVDAVIETSFHWRTVKEANPKLDWAWPEGAKSARLTIAGGPAATNAVFNTPGLPECEWLVQLPAEDVAECVYTFTLEFYPELECGGAMIAEASLFAGGIGVVRGVGGTAFRFVKTAAEDSALFSRIPVRNMVVPIPGGETALTIDGESRETVPGPAYFAWHGIGIGDHTVALSGVESFERNLERIPAGSFISIR